MNEATITYPDGLADALSLPEEELPAELAFLAGAKLYELGRLSASQAADLARMQRLDFLSRLAELGAPAINLRDEEIRKEIAAARAVGG